MTSIFSRVCASLGSSKKEIAFTAAGAVVLSLPLAYLYSSKRRRSCQARLKLGDSAFQNQHGRKCQIIAHRAARNEGPENTLGAIENAAFNGADGVEIDVQLSKDRQAVLFHDCTLKRTSDGQGKVKSKTFKELNSLNAASQYKGQWEEFEPIPTMQEAVEKCLKLKLFIVLDIKETSRHTMKQILEMFSKHPELSKYSVVSSFDLFFLYRMQWRTNGEMSLVPIYEGMRPLSEIWHSNATATFFVGKLFQTSAVLCRQFVLAFMFNYVNPLFLNYSTISVSQSLINEKFIKTWRRDWGKEIVVWTVNDLDQKMDLINNNQIAVITDYVLPHSDRLALKSSSGETKGSVREPVDSHVPQPVESVAIEQDVEVNKAVEMSLEAKEESLTSSGGDASEMQLGAE